MSGGVRNPTYAPDGRLAFELRGDVWILPTGWAGGAVQPVRVTSDPVRDGEPAWTRDGDAIIFLSDRSGSRDLWRVPMRPAGAGGAPERLTGATNVAGSPERLTSTARAEAGPSVGPDGGIVFVRGHAAASDLGLLGTDGSERRLTQAPGAERWPAIAPDGGTVAYVAERIRRTELRLLDLATGSDEAVLRDRAVEMPAWSPAGDRIAFTSAGRVEGVWVMPPWGGNFYVTPGLGFLYNDRLGSYRTDPGAWGARLPHARNTTSIVPTLVSDGVGPSARPLLATGAAGNAWITAAVYEIVTGVIDQDLGPQRAIELPRFLVSSRRAAGGRQHTVIQIEDGFAPDVIRELEAAGHDFQSISLKGELRMGYTAAVTIEDGRVRAGADPRRAGTAAAIP